MDFQITLVGLNHRTASVDVREKFALADHCDTNTWDLPKGGGISESLVLSTCNRVELLCVGGADCRGIMLERWAALKGARKEELEPYIYEHANLEAARHVFNVASSLDSMVLGEPQILGQLKEAYRKSVLSETSGSILNHLMHQAFHVAKRVRNETAVAASAVSISYAAVELARRIFGQMDSHRAILIGAGEMAELAATHLLRAGVEEILVINRTLTRGRELAEKFHGRALPFAGLSEALRDADIIISSTGSPEPVITRNDIKKVLKLRRNRPMFFIDIAVPRDIDPAINTLDNVYLYDIDDLKEVVEENMAGRLEEAKKAGLIINEEVASFGHWLETLEARPTIMELIGRGEQAARLELAKTLKRLGPISQEQKNQLEIMALAIARRLNHPPLDFLKRAATASDPNGVNLVRQVFNLDGNAPRGHK